MSQFTPISWEQYSQRSHRIKDSHEGEKDPSCTECYPFERKKVSSQYLNFLEYVQMETEQDVKPIGESWIAFNLAVMSKYNQKYIGEALQSLDYEDEVDFSILFEKVTKKYLKTGGFLEDSERIII